jgi:hypothetical protein
MRVIRRDDTFDAGQEFELWGLGDFHAGAPDFDEAALRRDIKRIADNPDARVVLMGDYGDLIDPRRDRRSDGNPIPERYRDAMFAEGGIPSETVAHICEMVEPIKDRVLGMLEGNHELTVRKHMDRSIASEIAAELDISSRLIGYGGFIHWGMKRRSSGAARASSVVTIHAHHGYQAGRRSGAKLNEAQLEKSRYPTADIIMRGHAHDRIGHVYDASIPGNHHVRDSPWVYVCTGTYKMGRVDTTINEPHHTTWEESKGFHPKSRSRLGPPVITVAPTLRNGSDPSEPAFHLRVTT